MKPYPGRISGDPLPSQNPSTGSEDKRHENCVLGPSMPDLVKLEKA